jgi:hypothetical protein
MATSNARLLSLRVAALFFALSKCTSIGLAADAQNRLVVRGQGQASCGRYLSDIALNNVQDNYYMVWMQGFVTATNGFAVGLGDILAGTDDLGAMAWVKNYCHQNPTNTFFDAVAALVVFMREKH